MPTVMVRISSCSVRTMVMVSRISSPEKLRWRMAKPVLYDVGCGAGFLVSMMFSENRLPLFRIMLKPYASP